MIETGKTYVTRNGNKARVICIDADAKYPVIALVQGIELQYADAESYAEDDKEKTLKYDALGRCFSNVGCDENLYDWDLMGERNIPPVRPSGCCMFK